ncbi:hypothetical protein CRENBAI_017972 [Crenichthys baileyi]|uniref:Uncharacterized protein n=1 Tax=Crenichthys baileyi TaxID=28760 RepID=A0AAV9QZ93_9TELE
MLNHGEMNLSDAFKKKIAAYDSGEGPEAPSGPNTTICRTGLFKSAAMKLFLIAALLVLALTHGSFAQDGAERMSQYLQNIKAKINQDFQEFMGHQELQDKAESFLEDRQMELEPLAAKIQDQLQDLKVAATNMEEQIKPLTAKVKEQVNPLIYSLQEKMEAMLQTLAKHTKTNRK